MPSLLRLPALQAFLIQLAAFVLVLTGALVVSAFTGLELSLLAAASLHGAMAAGLAWWRRMPRWWLWIHFLFAPALVFLLALRFPSWIYLLLFGAMLALYWQTFRTQVPFYPSTAAVRDAVAGLLPAGPAHCVDLGSGFGGLVLDLAARRPECIMSGIELAPLPWLCSVVRARLSGSRARFARGDYAQLDFGQYDVVFAYLSPAAMPALWSKARAEMRPGALLLSYEFAIPGVPPLLSLCPGPGDEKLYGWRI